MRSVLSFVVILLVLFCSPASGQGQEAFSLSLPQALELARTQNPELQAARRNIDIARGRLIRAQYLNQFNPELAGSAARRNFARVPGGSNDFDLSLSQEIEVAGQRGKRRDEAATNQAKVSQQVNDVERRILARVKNAFYRALYLKRRLALFREVETLNRNLQRIASARFHAGAIPKMEVNVAEIRLGHARKNTIGAERDYRTTLQKLERLVGLEPVGRTRPVGELTVTPQTFALDHLLRLAQDNRPDLRAAGLEQQRLQAQKELTQRLRIPNPTLQAFYREEEGGDTIIGGALSFPLPVFDRKQAELTQLAGQASQARYERQAVALRIQQEVRDAWRSYEAAQKEVGVFEAAVLERAEENFGLMETAYREGKIDLLQVVVVQNDLVNAQFSYVDSVWNYWQARIALERAVGQAL